MQPNLNLLTGIAQEVSSTFGLSVLDVKLGQQGRQKTLEVTIYRPGGRISLNDCEQVSRKLEEQLDSQSPPVIDGSFLLEVQSPGVDRKLTTPREFEVFTGQPVSIKIKQKVNGLGCEFLGKLMGLKEQNVLIAHPEKPPVDARGKKRKPAKAAVLEAEVPEALELNLDNVIEIRLRSDLPPLDEPAIDLEESPDGHT